MRGRFISADFWDDGRFDDWPMEKVFCYMGLWAAASDYGVLPTNDPGRLRNEIFPGRASVTKEMVGAWCLEMEADGLLIPFDAEDKRWWVIKGFAKRQPLRRKSDCGRPKPPMSDNVRQCPTMSALNSRTIERKNVRTSTPIVPMDGGAAATEPDPDLAEAIQVYEQEIGMPSGVIIEDLKTLLDEGAPVKGIVDAIKEAGRQNKRNWKYAAAIIDRRRREGWRDRDGPAPKSRQHEESPTFEEAFGGIKASSEK